MRTKYLTRNTFQRLSIEKILRFIVTHHSFPVGFELWSRHGLGHEVGSLLLGWHIAHRQLASTLAFFHVHAIVLNSFVDWPSFLSSAMVDWLSS